MKHFPLKTVVLCIILTPLFYTGMLPLIEKNLDSRYRFELENRIPGDAEKLFSGALDIRAAIDETITQFLRDDFLCGTLGLKLDVMVTASGGTILYPVFEPPDADRSHAPSLNSAGIARENFRLLSDGIEIRVRARLPHGSLGANLVLGFFCCSSILIFLAVYRRASRMASRDYGEKVRQIESLITEEQRLKENLTLIEAEREELKISLERTRKETEEDLKKASAAEDEMFDEIVVLEKRLAENLKRQEEKEKEIQALKDKLAASERRKSGKARRSEYELLEKRFSTLYKNIDMNRKAIAGYADLTQDQQIKAEELIHQLDSDDSQVTVKRKVFAGKKNKSISFEILFAYNGRLYFRKTESNRIEVLTVGTKNTQKKDMEFLHNL